MLWPNDKLDVAFKQIKKTAESSEEDGEGLCTLVLASNETDSVCACQMVVEALMSEDITFSLKSIRGFKDVESILAQRLSEGTIRSVILINCGGTVDLTKTFGDLLADVFIYVIDSHRPFAHANLYRSANRIILFGGEIDSLDDGFPAENDEYDNLASSSDEEDEDDDENAQQNDQEQEDELDVADRSEQAADASPRKMQRMQSAPTSESPNKRKARRDRVKRYYRSTSIGDPAAHVVYKLLEQLGKVSNVTTWFAIVGITSRYIATEISDDTYHAFVEEYQEIVQDKNPLYKRIRKSLDDKQTNVPMPSREQIDFVEDEIRLALYRHWSLAEACSNTEYFAARFGAWSADTGGELEHFFARLGLSLRDSSQKFGFMSRESKTRVREGIKSTAELFSFTRMTFPSFVFKSGFDKEISAEDLSRFIGALLDNSNEQSATSVGEVGGSHDAEGFSEACDVLSKSDTALGKRAQSLAMNHARLLTAETMAVIQGGLVQNAGDFRYAQVELHEDDDDRDGAGRARALFFSSPINVIRLAKHIISANQGNQKWVKKSAKPLVLAVSRKGKALITGVPCADVGEVLSNPFGKLFARTARQNNIDVEYNRFSDDFVLEISSDDIQRFLFTLSKVYPEG